jgi:hypothetical protein
MSLVVLLIFLMHFAVIVAKPGFSLSRDSQFYATEITEPSST